MLEFIIYMISSVVESSAMFYFAFKLFKIDLYPKEMVFAGFLMAFFSYTVRVNYGLAEIDALTQYILVFFFLWLLFRIHIFYAAIMTGMAYQGYMLIQSILYLVLNTTGLNKLNFPILSTSLYMLQIATAIVVFIIGHFISRRRKGFDFVPDKPDEKIIISNRDKILFAFSFPSILVVLLMLYFFENLHQFFVLIPILYAVLLYGYLYLSKKKDLGDEY